MTIDSVIYQAYERLLAATHRSAVTEDSTGFSVSADSIFNFIQENMDLVPSDVKTLIEAQLSMAQMRTMFESDFDHIDMARTTGLTLFLVGWMARDLQQDNRATVTFNG